MAEIAKITKIERTDKGIRISISTLSEPLFVSPSTVIDSKLTPGIVLTPSQVEILIHKSDLYGCERVTIRLLAMRAHSRGELVDKLRKRKFNLEVIEEIVKKKKAQGLIDDAKYAYDIGRQLLSRKPCGRMYLIAYLQRKKIDRKTADLAADVIFQKQDDVKLASEALERRWWRFSQLELETARKKAYNYLSRRGFSYDTVRQAFEQVSSKTLVEE